MTENFFKASYTNEERKACIEWFERNMERLPKELTVDKSTTSRNLPYTVKRMMMMLRLHARPDSSVYNGYLANLMLIRQRLRELPDWRE